jgi:hypothetical protein
MRWLLTIQNFPAPENRCLTPGTEAEKATILHSWTTLVGPLHGDGTGDYEDFWEQAYRLQAALDSFGADNIWLFVPGLREGHDLHLGTRELADLSTLRDLPVYGSQPRVSDHSTLEGPQALLADARRFAAGSTPTNRKRVLPTRLIAECFNRTWPDPRPGPRCRPGGSPDRLRNKGSATHLVLQLWALHRRHIGQFQIFPAARSAGRSTVLSLASLRSVAAQVARRLSAS